MLEGSAIMYTVQDSTDSQMPFLAHQSSWLWSFLPWRRKPPAQEAAKVPIPPFSSDAAFRSRANMSEPLGDLLTACKDIFYGLF